MVAKLRQDPFLLNLLLLIHEQPLQEAHLQASVQYCPFPFGAVPVDEQHCSFLTQVVYFVLQYAFSDYLSLGFFQ